MKDHRALIQQRSQEFADEFVQSKTYEVQQQPKGKKQSGCKAK